MTITEFAAPFVGFIVLLTLGLLGYSVWVYLTTDEATVRVGTRRHRVVYRVGLGVTVLAPTLALALACWALGRWVMGGW